MDNVIRKYPDSGASDWIGRQASDTAPILYLSGSTGSAGSVHEKEFREKTGARYRCFSFAYVSSNHQIPGLSNKQDKALMQCLKLGQRCFLDSGAHSVHNIALKGKTAAKGVHKADRAKLIAEIDRSLTSTYSDYIKEMYERGKTFDFYVVLDSVKNCRMIYDAVKKANKMGIYPIPVYHGDSSIDWVKRYIDDGHKLIGIGSDGKGKQTRDARRRYYSVIFNLLERHGVSAHGFAVTGDFMFEFPWYSVDSTSWVKAAAFGHLISFRPDVRQRLAQIHVSAQNAPSVPYGTISSMTPTVLEWMKHQAMSRGFDWEELRTDLRQRCLYNAKVFVEAVDFNTKKVKGEKWRPWSPLV